MRGLECDCRKSGGLSRRHQRGADICADMHVEVTRGNARPTTPGFLLLHSFSLLCLFGGSLGPEQFPAIDPLKGRYRLLMRRTETPISSSFLVFRVPIHQGVVAVSWRHPAQRRPNGPLPVR